MDEKQIYRRRLAIMLTAAAIMLAGVVFALSRDTRPNVHGSFTAGVPGRVESFDGRFYAEQSVERPVGDSVNRVKVTVYDAETKAPVGEFPAQRAFDFLGICWARDGYDIWVNSGDVGAYCMRYEDGAWVEDRTVPLPEYIRLG